MSLSGRIAAERPDIDQLKPVPLGIVTHKVRQADKGGTWQRLTAGPGGRLGRVDSTTGTYRTAVGMMTEAERREAGLRRNGRRR